MGRFWLKKRKNKVCLGGHRRLNILEITPSLEVFEFVVHFVCVLFACVLRCFAFILQFFRDPEMQKIAKAERC